MANGENNGGRASGLTWEGIARVSQIAVLPLLGAMFYMLSQMNTLDRRMAVLESGFNTMPQAYAQVLVLQEKVSVNNRKIVELESTLREMSAELRSHEMRSTYDPKSPYYKGR